MPIQKEKYKSKKICAYFSDSLFLEDMIASSIFASQLQRIDFSPSSKALLMNIHSL